MTKHLFLALPPLLLVCCLLMLVSISLPAKAHADQLTLNADQLDTLATDLIEEYQQFRQQVIDFRRLYDERGDHRGFMVWRHNAFSPALKLRNDYYQSLLTKNQALIEAENLQPLFELFASLEPFSVDVMLGLVEQDGDAILRARSLMQANQQTIDAIRQQRQLQDN